MERLQGHIFRETTLKRANVQTLTYLTMNKQNRKDTKKLPITDIKIS